MKRHNSEVIRFIRNLKVQADHIFEVFALSSVGNMAVYFRKGSQSGSRFLFEPISVNATHGF